MEEPELEESRESVKDLLPPRKVAMTLVMKKKSRWFHCRVGLLARRGIKDLVNTSKTFSSPPTHMWSFLPSFL
jgi:hypothetical protein